MQNWNQWQLSAGAVTTPMPQPPVGYAAPGADPMAMMQAYMQYYNQPAPSGYTPEQWAAAQQQSWAQWQQWQQQYQQWQAQYGGKYQETMKHMSAHNMSLAGQVPPLPNMQPPPLPKEDAKPPLPPNTINAYQFTNMPPPHQNNLPLFPAKQPTNNVMPQVTAPNCPQNPPLPPVQPPLPPENTPNKESSTSGKRGSNTVSEPSSVKKLKVEDEELTEAEKTFDAQFKQWEEQFNKWKQQNANHPDKTQYKQYEAKWTSWREKLIERREQMRKKREQQKQAAVKAETEKNLPGDDKILNILSSTENQGLINNLLGIGKTLGLTGKQNTNAPLPPPPPPPQTTISNMQSSTTMTVASQITTQQGMSQASGVNMMPSNVNPSSWTAQQWATQYNAGINMPNFSNFQSMSGIPPPPFGVPATQMPLPNFTQPPPNMPNFSQPPPGFGNNDATQFPHSNMRLPVPPTMQERSSFGPNDNVSEINRNDRQSISNNNFDSMKQPSSFGAGNHNVPKGQGMSTEHFGQDGPPKNIHDQGNQFRFNAPFGFRNDNYKFNNEGVSDADQFKRDDRNYSNRENNQFNHFASGNESFAPSSDRYGPDNDRLGSGNDRYGSNNERFGPGSDRFGTGNDRFVSNNDRFVPGNDRFNSGNDRFGLNDRFESNNDRFTSASDRLGGGNEHFGPGSDRFSRSNLERFEQKDVTDNRRDGFGSGSHGFNRNNQFEPPDELAPELKKLMEKRRAAMDVFKPSFFDPDKSSSASSLSESFKKIAGDAPFIPKTSDFGQKDQYGTRGNTNFGSRGGPNFSMPNNQRILGPDFRSREPNDFKPSSSLEFSPRSSLGFNPRNNDLRESGISDFRGSLDNFNRNIHGSTDFNQRSGKEFEPRSNASPKQVEYAANVISSDKDCSFVEKVQELSVQKNESIGKNEFTEADKQEIEENTLEKDSTKDRSLKQEIPLEKPPWMDVSFPEENSPRKNSSEQDGNTPTFVKQDQSTNSGDNLDPTESINDETMKKPETLPFMGENDPKPEDLNMEPPPELPNLGPILTDFVNESSFDNSQRTNESFDAKQSSGHFETKDNFDHSTFGSKGIYKPPPPPSPFGPRGPNDGRFLFGPRGPNNFSFGNGPTRPQIPVDRLFPPPADFGLRDPNDEPFIARGTMDGQFGPRGSNNRQFGPCRPNDTSLDSRGFDDHFSSRPTGDGSFPLPPNDKFFGSRRGPNDVVPNIRGSQDSTFAPRGANDGQFRGPRNGPFCPRGFADKIFDTRSSDNTFGPSGTNDRQFGPPRFSGPNEVPFVSRNSSDGSGQNRGDFGNRPPFGARAPDFRLRGQFDNAVCSKGANDSSKLNVSPLMPYKSESCRLDDIHEIHSERTVEINNADVQNSDLGKSSTLESNDKQSEYRNTDCGHLYGEVQKAEWRQNNFGDIDQRSRFDSGNTEKSDDQNERNQNSTGQRLNFSINKSSTPVDKLRTEKSASDCTTSSGHGEPSSGMDKFNNLIAYTKRSLDRQTQMRGPAAKEFCIEKQFNYNHGGTGDNKFIEHVPAKIIDYAHAPRTAIHDHLTPAQCFDYGHGNLKPVVPDHEIHPRKDFRNWVENEQNLREYADKIKKYENSIVRKDFRRPADYSKKRDWSMDDRKCERERRDRTGDLKDKEDRIFDSSFDKDQDDRLRNDRSNNKERIQERCDISRKDVKKENDKNDDRSKGNINWQESLNKNVIETKSQDISIPDVQHNVLESAPKTLELAKTPNCTMVDDLLCPPGRQNRPPKIVIILRGPPGSGKSFVAKLIKDKEVEQGGSAPRILSLDDYFLVEKEIESKDDNEKKVIVKEMVYEYEEAMEHSYIISLIKAFKKNITDGFFNFIILDCINEKISDYEEMWSFAKSKGFRVYVCEMEMDLQICLKRNVHNRTEEEINRIIDYFEPTPSYHQKLDVNSMLQEQAIEEVHMEDSQETQDKSSELNEDSQDSQEDLHDTVGVSKWERMEAEDKLDRLDGLAKRKNESKPQTMEDFLQVPDYYNMEDTSGKKRVRWADLEERKEQEKMRAVGFVVGHTNWDRMMDPTKGGSALTRTKFFTLS